MAPKRRAVKAVQAIETASSSSRRAPSRASKRGATSPPPDPPKPSKVSKKSAAATAATSTRRSRREKSESKAETEEEEEEDEDEDDEEEDEEDEDDEEEEGVPDPREDLASDPWTDAEETLLFKSLVKWKPAGLHKHFRMLAIYENMRSNGFGGSGRYVETPSHVRIPGIWEKLGKLYDLSALDQRENAHEGINSDEGEEEEEEEEAEEDEEGGEAGGVNSLWAQKDFALPDDANDPRNDFGELMWERRFVKGGRMPRSESPQAIPGLNQTRSQPGVTLSGTAEDEEEEDREEEEEEEEPAEEEQEEEEETKSKKSGRRAPKPEPKTRKAGRRR